MTVIPTMPRRAKRADAVWRTLGRVAVSAACAVAVVWGSQFVRPAGELAVPDGGARVADVNLAEVRLDLTTLRTAIESIEAAAPPGVVVVDERSLADYEDRPPMPDAVPVARLRNVRLGAALAVALDVHELDPGRIEVRQEPGRVVIGGPGTARREIGRRLYDVRDLLVEQSTAVAPQIAPIVPPPPPATTSPPVKALSPAERALPLTDRWAIPTFTTQPTTAPTGGGLFGGSGGAVPLTAPVTPLPYDAQDLAWQIASHGDVRFGQPDSGWRAFGWDGWLVIEAPADAHRRAEALLLMLRRGESADVRRRLAGPWATTTDGGVK